jgi:predicted RNA binding protein YcfA (HicA-like mRNA interferase family)
MSLLTFWYHIDTILIMPRKIRQLIKELEKAGFISRGGKGNHRNLIHPKGIAITISGKPGDDAKHYQEKEVELKITRSKK